MIKQKEPVYLELLSPAKDLQAGIAAVNAGADAVYIGGPVFSARSSAGNSWGDIKDLCDYAHQFYAKVYVTVNTIFFDGEEDDVKSVMDNSYKAGADALIIQDMGILKLDPPPVPLIASTQCNNYDPEHIRFLRDAGFSRAILARELTLEQIKDIRLKVSGIELEAFIHGAICISLSGRCNFSQFLSKRSANRGKCMQVCRMKFDLTDADGKIIRKNSYLLSPKDMRLEGELENLISAGVTSFKIEGRLKDASYTSNVTAAYSNELNRIISKGENRYKRASSGRTELKFEPKLAKSFNRGSSKYFLYGRNEKIISETGQKSVGESIGTVKSVHNDHFILNSGHDLKNGDGICWTGIDGELCGVNINTVNGQKIYPNRLIPHRTGIEIYRNDDPAFEKISASGAERKISVKIEIEQAGSAYLIKAEDEDGNSAGIFKPHEKEPALDLITAEENIRKQFGRTGGTIFSAADIQIRLKEPDRIKLSQLNAWRRDLLDKLLQVREDGYTRTVVNHDREIPGYSEKTIGQEYNVANSYARDFYEKAGAKVAEPACETTDLSKIRTLMTAKYCIKHELGACPGQNDPKVLKEPLYLLRNGKRFRLEFDCANCLMRICPPELF